ncbi:hypothetical protein HaLaN_17515 [Haematococcus lacustris]|uniref:Uncharacterized protein n=1 Tax=Haematococcus lacustris TaxID=44745 RepID=A0A699ZCS6_HAELA|nr:hypothetical protein HaLaN_17515 [Haematococcus lacustris]
MGLLSWLLPQSSAEQAHQAKLCSTVMPEVFGWSSVFNDELFRRQLRGCRLQWCKLCYCRGSEISAVSKASTAAFAVGDDASMALSVTVPHKHAHLPPGNMHFSMGSKGGVMCPTPKAICGMPHRQG